MKEDRLSASSWKDRRRQGVSLCDKDEASHSCEDEIMSVQKIAVAEA